MHGPWHMPEHPDECAGGDAAELADWEAHMLAHMNEECPDLGEEDHITPAGRSALEQR